MRRRCKDGRMGERQYSKKDERVESKRLTEPEFWWYSA